MQMSTILGMVQDSTGIGPLLAVARRLAVRRARRRSPKRSQDATGTVTADFQSDLPIRAVSIRVALWQPPS